MFAQNLYSTTAMPLNELARDVLHEFPIIHNRQNIRPARPLPYLATETWLIVGISRVDAP